MGREFYPIDDEGQVTPHSDALSEVEGSSSFAGTNAADVAASLRAAGVGRTSDERGFSRDKLDIDIGQDEFFRYQLARRAATSADLDSVLNSVQATRAQNAANLDSYTQFANAFWHSLAQSNGTFNNSLVQNDSIVTDKEAINLATLAQMVMALADEVSSLKSE